MALSSDSGKALWIVPVPEFGGVARHVLDVARAGLPGYELYVLAPEGALTRSLKELGVKVFADRSFGTEAGFKSSYTRLNEIIEQIKPDILHSHLAYADIVAAAVVTARKVGRLKKRDLWVPLLATTEHGIADRGSVYNSNRLRALTMKAIHLARLQVTDIKIAVSASTAEQMKKQWGARGVAVVRNGVDYDGIRVEVSSSHLPNETGQPRILSLSRLSEEKGLEILIPAFAEYLKANPKARLEVAGVGPLRGRLEQEVAALGIQDSVSFPGFVKPLEAMGRNDMVVQLSVWENLSYTLLEAKAAGLRVVATDVGGNAEIVDENELVPPLAGMSKDEAISLVSAAINRVWSQAVVPGKTLPSRGEMCQEIAGIYRKGGQINNGDI